MYSLDIGGDELSCIHWAIGSQSDAIEQGLLQAADTYVVALAGLAEEVGEICENNSDVTDRKILNSRRYTMHLRNMEQVAFQLLVRGSIAYLDALIKDAHESDDDTEESMIFCIDSKDVFAGLSYKSGNMPANKEEEQDAS